MSDPSVSENPKFALRKRALALRATLPIPDLSEAIARHIARHPLFLKAPRVLFYHPFRNELDLRPLAEQFPEKQWFLPAIEAEAQMVFHPYYPDHALTEGLYGIHEPTRLEEANCLSTPDLRPDDLMIVPGLIFDRAGYRIGYGKGYFDRFLGEARALKTSCVTFGAVPNALLWDSMPTEGWDLPVDWLVSETGPRQADSSIAIS